ncbi:MAG: HD domain-containing protein [Promethearchaeia archaeon]
MIQDQRMEMIKNFARRNSAKEDIHGFPHVMRVFNMCMVLAKNLTIDSVVLKISALLHDIGRIKEKKEGKNHAELSAEMAKGFFESTPINISKDTQERILHCIRAHSFSNGVSPETIEAKILSDADKLDALGPIGLYRTIGFTVKNGGGLKKVMEHLENKILRLKDLLYLDQSKVIAQKKHGFVLNFYQKLRRNY